MTTEPQSRSLVPIKCVCGVIGAYHVVLGLCGLVAGEVAVRSAAIAFGLSVDKLLPVTDAFEVYSRFIGALALAFGVMMLLAAAKPRANRTTVIGGVIYFAVRILSRILFHGQLLATFDVSFARNLRSIATMSVLLVGLLVFFPWRGKPEEKAAP